MSHPKSVKRKDCNNCDGSGRVPITMGCPDCNQREYLPYGYLKGYKLILRALEEAERVIKAQNNGNCLVSILRALSKIKKGRSTNIKTPTSR